MTICSRLHVSPLVNCIVLWVDALILTSPVDRFILPLTYPSLVRLHHSSVDRKRLLESYFVSTSCPCNRIGRMYGSSVHWVFLRLTIAFCFITYKLYSAFPFTSSLFIVHFPTIFFFHALIFSQTTLEETCISIAQASTTVVNPLNDLEILPSSPKAYEKLGVQLVKPGLVSWKSKPN